MDSGRYARLVLGRLLYGPKVRVELPRILVRGSVLNIDLLRDLDEQSQTDVAPVLVTLQTYANAGIRAVKIGELADLSGNERVGLVLEGFRDHQRVFMLPVGLTRPDALCEDPTLLPALLRAIDRLQASGRPIPQWRRVAALLPALLACVGAAFWVAMIATEHLPWPAIVSGTAAAVVVGFLAAVYSGSALGRFDREPVAHRFDPISYREIAADRANRRRDFRVAVLTAAGAVIVALVLWLVGIKA